MPGIDSVPYLTKRTVLDIDAVPRHLIILGGSYVGLEFAQIFRRFGARSPCLKPGLALVPARTGDLRRDEGHPGQRRHPHRLRRTECGDVAVTARRRTSV